MKKQTTITDVFIQYYEGIVLFGIIMIALAMWLYKYHYTNTGDDLVGLISACSMFFGILLLGQGIRGWKDSEEFRNKYIKMKSKGGADIAIKKRKRKWFR